MLCRQTATSAGQLPRTQPAGTGHQNAIEMLNLGEDIDNTVNLSIEDTIGTQLAVLYTVNLSIEDTIGTQLAVLYTVNLSIEDTIGTQLAVLYTVEPLYRGHHWDLLAVLYREVCLIQRYICTQLYVVGTADSVLIREVCLIQSVLYREVPL